MRPDSVSERLADDLARVAALGRGGARVERGLAGDRLVEAVRAQADRLTFESPVAAATAVLRHVGELPYNERESDCPIACYHRSASATVTVGDLVGEGLDLVFVRRGEEPNRTGIRLEAVVRVAPSGVPHLVSYGWPTCTAGPPILNFAGHAAGYWRQLLADLRTHHSPAGFERAMLMAYGGRVASLREGTLPGLARQREVLGLVARRLRQLAGYLGRSIHLAERGDPAGWTAASVRRAALESLFAGLLGSVAFDLVNADALAHLDRAIIDTGVSMPEPVRRSVAYLPSPV
ncbi:MAG TPA: hypothetical protein VFZ32_15650 [Micromonosporaceae bacterium]